MVAVRQALAILLVFLAGFLVTPQPAVAAILSAPGPGPASPATVAPAALFALGAGLAAALRPRLSRGRPRMACAR